MGRKGRDITKLTTIVMSAASVALGQITAHGDVRFRSESLDPARKANLASAIGNIGRALDPVLLRQPDAAHRGWLILLDKMHGVTAYRALTGAGEIPALILIGVDLRGALGAAQKANAKRVRGAQADAAWRLAREPAPRFTVREIAFGQTWRGGRSIICGSGSGRCTRPRAAPPAPGCGIGRLCHRATMPPGERATSSATRKSGSWRRISVTSQPPQAPRAGDPAAERSRL